MKTIETKLNHWPSKLLIGLLATASALPVMATPQYNFQSVTFPNDPAFTQLLGINNDKVIAGYHGDGQTPQTPNKGFTLVLPSLFTDENFPGSAQTQVVGINNRLKNGGFYVADAVTHGFVLENGTYTTLDAPGTAFNQILSVNDLGEAAGYSSTDPAGGSLQQAFVYSSTSATFTYVPLPVIPLNSQATGINDAHIVCGFYQIGANTVGFLWDKKTNKFKTLTYPHAKFTQALGINNAGQIVGVYSKDGGLTTHGFIYKQGDYDKIDVPNSNGATTVNSINDRGQIVGFYTNRARQTVGFVGTPKKALW